jgi:hypothetical protein
MRWDQDGMMVVRAELCDRLDTLRAAGTRIEVRELVRGLSTIRTIAAAYGMAPVVSLAEAFERAVRIQPRGCPAGLYFDRLRDAIGCERIDDAASTTYLASVSVRLGD